MADALDGARAAFGRSEWITAYEAFAAAAAAGPLETTDHAAMGVAAYMIGRDDESTAAWEAAHRAALSGGDPAEAARCAFWAAFGLMMRGQMAQAGGWLARAEGLVDDIGRECAAAGYLLIPALLRAIDAGEPETARDLALRASRIGAEVGDADLLALATLGHGQALIALGDPAGGIARLDEVMLSVAGGEVGPVASGIAYCAVVLECMHLHDLPRATEWTEALSSWCDGQPDLVPYRGQCLVHRSQIHQAAGDWPEAMTTAETACRWLTDPPHPALGMAHYQEAELRRLVGDLENAESKYREAARHGHPLVPGLALLELARGDTEQARATIDRALGEAAGQSARPTLLAAAVEIRRAAGDLEGAEAAAAELSESATATASTVLAAMAGHSTGAVLLALGEPAAALAELRPAASAWQSLKMPYELARTTTLVGLACSALGDETSARVDFDNARDAFARLGAGPDVDRLNALTGTTARRTGTILTKRELDVLSLLAAGRTNREIATELHISQHTVGRHVENIYAKLGVSSRAAATAHAYEHDLL